MIGAVNNDVVVPRDGQSFELCEQLALAEVTAIRSIFPICRVVQLLRFNLQMVETEVLHKARSLLLLELRIGRADRRDTKGIFPQNTIRHVRKVSTVNAATEAHNDASQLAENLRQPLLLLFCGHCFQAGGLCSYSQILLAPLKAAGAPILARR